MVTGAHQAPEVCGCARAAPPRKITGQQACGAGDKPGDRPARLPLICEGRARLTLTLVSWSFFPFLYFLLVSQSSVCVSHLAFYLYLLSLCPLKSSFPCLNFILASPLFSLGFYFLTCSMSYEFSPFPSFLFPVLLLTLF